tara:strand:- start:5073 stop:5510 length:438 start_codon:yes stop_codon:yes gene_type:complete
MININDILNDDGEFNEGILVSPNWITKDKDDKTWVFHTTESALKELRKIKRMKGRKSWSVVLDFSEHLSDWIDVTYPILMNMVRNRDSRFRNCTIKQVWYIKLNDIGNSHRVSIWPASIRNENENKENDWGREQSKPSLFGGEEE